jgi:hypothetical protein
MVREKAYTRFLEACLLAVLAASLIWIGADALSAWDPDKPAGSQKFYLMDDDIRANNTAIENVIGDLLDTGDAITATATEINTGMDGITATAAELNAVASERPVFVTNTNGNPNMSDTLFAPISNLVADTWESVGSVASGADNSWTAMADVPVGVDWIEVCAIFRGTSTNPGALAYLYLRETGSTQTVDDDNIVLYVYDNDTGGTAVGGGCNCLKVPVDSSARFDAYVNSTFTTNYMSIRLQGYGYN